MKYGRYWIRTSDPFRVKEVRYHCANRPHDPSLNHWVVRNLVETDDRDRVNRAVNVGDHEPVPG